MTDISATFLDLAPDQRAQLRRRLWERGLSTAALGDQGGETPASFTQRRLAFLQQLAPESAAYHSHVTYRLTGELNIEALERALNDILARHSALRTVLPVREGRPVQEIVPARHRPLPVIDLSALPASQRQKESARLAQAQIRTPFDLAAGPLTRFCVLRLADRESILFIVFHHAVVDGWSLGVFARDITEAYAARLSGGRATLPALRTDYAEYARWQADWAEGDEARQQLAYWTQQLAGAPDPLPLLTDHPRSATPASLAETITFTIGRQAHDAVMQVAARTRTTPFMIFLAAFQVVLAAYSGQDDVVVGTPVANRRFSVLHDLVGFFANSIPLRSHVQACLSFEELLAQVRETCLDGYDHQDVPLDLIARELHPDRDIGRNPLYQVNLTLHNTAGVRMTMPGLEITELDSGDPWARFDLDLNVFEAENGWDCHLAYATSLFESATATRMIRALTGILHAVASDSRTTVGDLPLADNADIDLIRRWNRASAATFEPAPVHQMVERQTRRSPDAVAISCGGEMTYRELDMRANGVAHGLRARGIGPGSVVALLLPETPDLVIALLGVLKAGAAYLPMDPVYPPARLRRMLAEGGAVLLSEPSLAARLGSGNAEVLWFRDLDTPATEPPVVGCHADDLMYVMFTSGSTGGPKGVMVSHRNVANYIQWAASVYAPYPAAEPYPAGQVPVHSSVAFDLTVTSIFVPLITGRQVLLGMASGTPGEWLEASARSGPGFAFVKLTPSHLRMIEGAGIGQGSGLWTHDLVVGGEDLRESHIAPWRKSAAVKRIFNEYGPTEAAVACAAYEVTDGTSASGRIPIGRPVHNVTLHVLNEFMRPLPIGAPGELYVGGTAVTYGYLNRPALTAERYVPDPFAQADGAGGRLYRTGDLVRYLPDGNLEYLGRVDNQLKVRGHRVEPGEITGLLDEHPDVRESAVLLDAQQNLVAFVAPRHGGDDSEAGSAELIEQWRLLYEDTYGGRPPSEDSAFDLAGWNRTDTRVPFDSTEMQEWLDQTVSRIRELRPRRILEIGCGTGMIFSRFARDCDYYLATDVSAAAIENVREISAGWAGQRIEFTVAAAHQSLPPGEGFDTVILNSVAQYFPSVGYLLDVLEQAVERVSAGGHIFIGDVRNLALLETFYTAVLAQQAAAGWSAARLRAEIRRRVEGDEELCLDPRLFRDLPTRIKRITGVQILLKRGRYLNELSRYRYDVVLTVDGPRQESIGSPDQLDWAADQVTVPALDDVLASKCPDHLLIRNVPNARLVADLRLRDILADAPPDRPVASIHMAADGEPDEAAPEPETIWSLGDRHPYAVELTWAHGRADGSFDVLLRRAGTVERATAVPDPHGPLEVYANDPSWRIRFSSRLPAIDAHVRDHLPGPMAPQRYLPVRGLPRTVNGKADQAALRGLLSTPDDDVPSAQPVLTQTQRAIADIWAELLTRDGFRSDDNFFDVGGHSLLTFQLVFRLREKFGVDVPIRAPFDAPTLAAQADLIDDRLEAAAGPAPRTAPALVPRPRQPFMPAAPAQERMWFAHERDKSSSRYNYPVFFRFDGELDVRLLDAAIADVIGRHEVLRTVIVARDGRLYQQVLAPDEAPGGRLPVADLSGCPEAVREAELARLSRQQYARPFDLARPPVVRRLLVRLSDREHALLLTMHHISVDGWSTALLLDEIAAGYTARRDGGATGLATAEIQYADYAAWQRDLADGGHYSQHLDYWRRQLDGVAGLPGIPMDRPRPRQPTHSGRMLTFEVPADVGRQLQAVCRYEGVTLFMAQLAALYALLRDWTGHTDLVVGTDVANRPNTAAERLMGFFVNQVVLRADLSGAPTWRELLRRVKARTLEAYAHQEVPFEEVVRALNPRRDRNESPLFQVKLVFHNAPRSEFSLPGLRTYPIRLDNIISTSRFDITLLFAEDGHTISGFLDYDTDLFDAETMAPMPERYLALLRHMAEAPDAQPLRLTAPEAAKPTGERRGGPMRIAPAKVTLTTERAVVRQELAPGSKLPLLISPGRDDVDLAGWALAGRDSVNADLREYGAVLFRGFHITEPSALERFAAVFVDDLFAENGEHPRTQLSSRVYTPVFFPPEEKLLWHNENSFNAEGPTRIWFCCGQPAEQGGETPLADSREVYRLLDPELRDEFSRKGVTYERTYGTGLGLDWRTVFRTDDRREAEAKCEAQGLRFEWRGDRLRTAAVRPAAIRHPQTREWSWFNQAQHWHLSSLDEATRHALLTTYDRDELPRSCSFGDGSAIPDDAMAAICAVYQELEVAFPWQRGDVLMLDNILAAHARNPFQGERRLFVAMGGMTRFE